MKKTTYKQKNPPASAKGRTLSITVTKRPSVNPRGLIVRANKKKA